MKRFLLSFLLALALCGCGAASPSTPAASSPAASMPSAETACTPIPYEGEELYALVYLGYQEPWYLSQCEPYLDISSLPAHHVSLGDVYLVIPRYEGMAMTLSENDLESGRSLLFYETPSAEPFLLYCNVSDIFPDVTVSLTYGGETVAFSPYISLMDGSVQPGERGYLLTP